MYDVKGTYIYSITKDSYCSDHLFKLTATGSTSHTWGTTSGSVTVIWNCDDFYIYGQTSSDDVSCATEQDYTVTVVVTEDTVTATAVGANGETCAASVSDSIGGDDAYIVVGADCDSSCDGAQTFNSMTLCPGEAVMTPEPTHSPSGTPTASEYCGYQVKNAKARLYRDIGSEVSHTLSSTNNFERSCECESLCSEDQTWIMAEDLCTCYNGVKKMKKAVEKGVDYGFYSGHLKGTKWTSTGELM